MSNPHNNIIEELVEKVMKKVTKYTNLSQGQTYEAMKDAIRINITTSFTEGEKKGREETEKDWKTKIKESRWECPIHGLPEYKKTDCLDCKQALEVNVVLDNLLAQARIRDKE